MNKWVVKRRPQVTLRRNIWGETWEEQEKPWIAQPQKRSYRQKRFDTHAEAIAWADEQARKVKTVLPRTKHYHEMRIGLHNEIKITRFKGSTVIEAGGGNLTIYNDELKPLSAYLLALYYEQENK